MYQTILKIDGMHCSMCESHVNGLVRRSFNVKKVSSSAHKGQAEILSEGPIEEEKVREAFEPTGYRVLGFESYEVEKKGLFGKIVRK